MSRLQLSEFLFEQAFTLTSAAPKHIQLKTGSQEVVITTWEIPAVGDDVRAAGLKSPTISVDGTADVLLHINFLESNYFREFS